MLDFSEYLQNFMKTNSISMVELSKETDIDRTVIYRYVKGTRIPSDINIVIRIADAMQMSVNEKKYLLNEYDKLVLGETMVYSYQYIQKLLRNLGKLDEDTALMNSQWRTICDLKMDAPIIELKTKEEIVAYLLNLFQYIAELGGTPEKMFLVMQPTYHEIQRFIPRIFQQGNVEIEQIVCMEQNINQSYKNLEVFYAILPLCFSLRGYNVLYYYDSLNNHVNSMVSMPNILIVRDYVVQFDYEMEHGLVVKSDTYAGTIRKQYKMMRKKSRNLLMRSNKQKWSGNYYTSAHAAGQMQEPACSLYLPDMCGYGRLQKNFIRKGYFSEQLYMGNCLDRGILERCFNSIPGKEEFIENLMNARGGWAGGKYTAPDNTAENIISYGTYDGIEEFMRTGRIKEFPEEWYAPLSLEERVLVLNRMIDLAKSEQVDYHLLSFQTELPARIQIYWDEENKRFGLNRVTAREVLQVVVDEQSIYRTFQMYLEYLEKKEMVLEKKKSMEYLLGLQRRYEGC